MTDILLAGVGGQGTVLASKILAKCAIARGETAHTAETIGMAQRGGSVVSHVRIGDGEPAPLIAPGCADVIIGFEPGEAVRALPYLKKGGCVVTASSAVQPVTASLSDSVYDGEAMTEYLRKLGVRLIVVDNDYIIRSCGSPKCLNIALLGAAVSAGVIGTGVEEIEAVVVNDLPQKFRQSNLAALKAGASEGKGSNI